MEKRLNKLEHQVKSGSAPRKPSSTPRKSSSGSSGSGSSS
jgi:hypothetical protein